MARQEMEKLAPEIREQVVSIIDSLKGTKETLTEKSITDSLAYVRCPHCYSRVYRANTILVSDSDEQKEKKPEEEKPAQQPGKPQEGADTDEGKKPEEDEKEPKKKSADVPSSSFWASLSAATKK